MADNRPDTTDDPEIDVERDRASTRGGMEGLSNESQGSATDILSIDETKNQLGVIVGTFALTGFAIGLAGYFALGAFTGDAGGQIQGLIVGIMLLVGFLSLTVVLPVLGTIIGLLSSSKLRSVGRITTGQTLTTVGVGVLGGTIIAIVLAMVIMGAQIPATGGMGGGGGTGGVDGIGELLMDIVLIAIATAVAGVGAAYLNLSYDTLSR